MVTRSRWPVELFRVTKPNLSRAFGFATGCLDGPIFRRSCHENGPVTEPRSSWAAVNLSWMT